MTTQINISHEGEARQQHRAWLADYTRWRTEHRKALVLLNKVQAAILEREAAIEKNAAEIESHEAEMHDYDMIGIEPFSPDPAKQVSVHADFERRHEQARDNYQRTKQRHVDIVGEVEKLYKICQPAE